MTSALGNMPPTTPAPRSTFSCEQFGRLRRRITVPRRSMPGRRSMIPRLGAVARRQADLDGDLRGAARWFFRSEGGWLPGHDVRPPGPSGQGCRRPAFKNRGGRRPPSGAPANFHRGQPHRQTLLRTKKGLLSSPLKPWKSAGKPFQTFAWKRRSPERVEAQPSRTTGNSANRAA